MKATRLQLHRMRQRRRINFDNLGQQMAESLDRLHEMMTPQDLWCGTVIEPVFH